MFTKMDSFGLNSRYVTDEPIDIESFSRALKLLNELGTYGISFPLIEKIYLGIECDLDNLERFSSSSAWERSGKPGRPRADKIWEHVVLARYWHLMEREGGKLRNQRRKRGDIAEQALTDIKLGFGRGKFLNWSPRYVLNLASAGGGRVLISDLRASTASKLQTMLADVLMSYH